MLAFFMPVKTVNLVARTPALSGLLTSATTSVAYDNTSKHPLILDPPDGFPCCHPKR